MKKSTGKWILLTGSVLALAVSCKRDLETTELPYQKPNLPETPAEYRVNSSGFFGLDIDNNKATLGRVLFYDKHLSYNDQVACGSCHHQGNAFADDKKFSLGFAGAEGVRNAPPIFNLTASSNLFWDSRATNLQDMVLMPVKHREEMGMEDVSVLEKKLKGIPYYPDLFEKAFGSKKITVENISTAISQFLLAIRSNTSKYDDCMHGGASFTTEEARGRDLYFDLHCQSCHRDANSSPYYSTPSSFNIGLDKTYSDKGREGITKKAGDEGMFKAPQLRNLIYTAPYMHDGRFTTLEEVVDHYNEGVVDHPNLAPILRDLKWGNMGWGRNTTGKRNKFGVPTLELTDADKKDLVAFLKTMTDEKMIKDKRFSDPFIN